MSGHRTHLLTLEPVREWPELLQILSGFRPMTAFLFDESRTVLVNAEVLHVLRYVRAYPICPMPRCLVTRNHHL
jgi:hypothetical protein